MHPDHIGVQQMKNQFLRRKRVTVAGNCLGGPKIVNFRHGQFWDRAEIGNFGTRLEGAGPTSRAPRRARGGPGPARPWGPARRLRVGSQNCRCPHGPKIVNLIIWLNFKIDHGGD